MNEKIFHSFTTQIYKHVSERSSSRKRAAALIVSYLQSLGQHLGILCSFILVLLCSLSLQGDAAALVLQHTRSHQALDLRGLGPGLLTYGGMRWSSSHAQTEEERAQR